MYIYVCVMELIVVLVNECFICIICFNNITKEYNCNKVIRYLYVNFIDDGYIFDVIVVVVVGIDMIIILKWC